MNKAQELLNLIEGSSYGWDELSKDYPALAKCILNLVNHNKGNVESLKNIDFSADFDGPGYKELDAAAKLFSDEELEYMWTNGPHTEVFKQHGLSPELKDSWEELFSVIGEAI